jgi:hypothetical protein
MGGWSPIGSTRHYGHQHSYCASPGWLWWRRNWWNDDWQGKPKYSEKTCSNASLSTTNFTCSARTRTWATAVGNQRQTTWATARPQQWLKKHWHPHTRLHGVTDRRTTTPVGRRNKLKDLAKNVRIIKRNLTEISRLRRVLTMVYNTQNYWVFRLCPSSGF